MCFEAFGLIQKKKYMYIYIFIYLFNKPNDGIFVDSNTDTNKCIRFRVKKRQTKGSMKFKHSSQTIRQKVFVPRR